MQIIYQFDTHLDRRGTTPILDAVQGESGRAVTVAFHEKNQPWPIPADAHLLVRYGRPDNCGGIYDTLPDGTPACTVDGNAVTAVLVPQALAVAGHVNAQLAVISQGVELASFIFLVRVESDPSVGTAATEDYINLLPELLEAAKSTEQNADRAEAAADRAEQLAQKMNATIPLTFIEGSISRETGAYIPGPSSVSYYFPIIGGRIGLTIPSYFAGTIHYYDHQLTHLDYMELIYGATYDTPGYYEKQLTNGAKFARVVVQQIPSGVIEDTSSVRAYVTGTPGITPHIGENGNWWIGSQDTGVSAVGSGLTTAQITALDELFRIAAYTADASAKYAAFRSAFGLDEPSEPDEPNVPDVPDEPDVPSDVVVPEGFSLVRHITSDELIYGYGLDESKPVEGYTLANPTRACYALFDIPVEYGYIYKFSFVSTDANSQIGTRFYNEVAKNHALLNDGANIKTDIYDPGVWHENGAEITAPELINNSPIAGVRIVLRKDQSNSNVEDGMFASVTISRKAVS